MAKGEIKNKGGEKGGGESGNKGDPLSVEAAMGGSANGDLVVPEAVPGGAGNVDQIRDILFGSQMRDYDRRFQLVEEGLKRELAELRSELKAAHEALEEHHRGEFRDIRDALKRETDDRLEAQRELAAAQKEAADLAYQRLKGLEADVDRRAAELRDQILQQSRLLSDDIQARDERLTASLTDTSRDLEHRKVDRKALAQLLVEVAMRMAEDSGDESA
ncbi:MAG: hypothetical protein AAGE43_12470 [Pseudomonadota bacterium]